ncbi:MAG: hypothetical protein HY340_01150 [Candidatus Kerfeldbacteria bacterium]|nr:hypothetical protein [Candidatus Kerfeldbacteria bacterium]
MTAPNRHLNVQRILLGAGVLLWSLMGVFTVRGATQQITARSRLDARLPIPLNVPFARATIGNTTCGTYAPNCGGVDCGFNQPFVEGGQNDPDCDTVPTGNNVCDNGSYPNCYCQQASGGDCNRLDVLMQQWCAAQRPPIVPCPVTLMPPQPPLVATEDIGSQWEAQFKWWTNQRISSNNCSHYIRDAAPVHPDQWKCIYGDEGFNCAQNLRTVCINDPGYYHESPVATLGENEDYWYSVESYAAGLPILRSEVRSFRTYVEDFTIDVALPVGGGDKVATGETTQQYKATITPIGGISGQIALSIDNWNPAIAGQTINWIGGNTVNIAGPNPIDKFFTIGTSAGAPPVVPPTTLPEVYDFRVVGDHATAGTRTKDVQNGLTVMDYRMDPTVTQLTMDPTGDTETYTINFSWLPAGWPYNRQVTLTPTSIPGLNVVLSQNPVDMGVNSITVTLTTNGVVPNTYNFDILGQGGAPGNLQRRARIQLSIINPPDFSVSMQTASQTLQQGATSNNQVTVQSLFGFTEQVTFTGAAVQQGQVNPEPSITFTFNPPAVAPPANGSVGDAVTLRTTNATPCAATPGQQYTVTITGRDAPGGQPPNANRTTTYTVFVVCPTPPDFSLSMLNPSVTVLQNAAGSNRVIVQSLFGFSEAVDLDGRALEQGEVVPEPTIVITFNPPLPVPPANGSIQSVATLNTEPTTPCAPAPGRHYVVTVRGTDAAGGQPPNATRSTTFDLWVVCAVPPSFTLAANPTTRTVTAGDATTYQITATAQNGFADTVILDSPIGIPAGTSYTAPPSGAVQPGAPWVFSFGLDTDVTTPPGSYQITLPAHAQGDPTISASVIVTLDVTGIPDYTFDVTPQNLSVSIGSSGTYTVDVNPSNGFATPIRFTWALNPASPNVGFNPTSGNLVIQPGNSGTITVTANPGSAGTYFVDFTATPQGAGNIKTLNGIIQLTIGVAACTGDCPNVCVDQNNQALVPQQICSNDSDCPATYRCAYQTCNGANGCIPDPLAGSFDCNKDECYNIDGTFIIPPAGPQCYQSWPRCQTYEVLKVRKDRQCNKWLSCEDAVTYEDPATKKATTQCLNLGVCNQLGPTGECMNLLPTVPKENMSFLSPVQTAGAQSAIRWFSGYSSGFRFTGDSRSVCAGATGTVCTTDADCGANGPCVNSQIIESNYPGQVIEETGLDGATATDLVANGTFEQMRCDGGPRDGQSCILTSDCRVGSGICANNESGAPGVVSSPCESKTDCSGTQGAGGINTPYCRFLKESAVGETDVVCKNPLRSFWLGVVPPGAAVNEAGFGQRISDPSFESDRDNGLKRNNAGEEAVYFMVREDDENFQPAEIDARHPVSLLWPPEKHTKDGGNFLRVHVKADADRFSGVGVPITDGLRAGGSYTATFKFRYIDNREEPEKVKVQLGYNYLSTGNVNYDNAAFTADDFEIVQGSGNIELPVTTEWQTFTLGPITTRSFNQTLTPFLSFVTNTKTAGKTNDTVFDLDSVSLKPVLETAKSRLTATDTKKLERRCRLFPRDDSPECDYLDDNFTRYKGWKGYCLDKDPQNENLCLTWWPLDLLAGESPFTVPQNVGYDGRSPLYYCMQAEGGPLLASINWNLGSNPNWVRGEWHPTGLRWRDLEKVKFLFDFNSSDDFRGDCWPINGDTAECQTDNNWYGVTLKQNIRTDQGTVYMGGICERGVSCPEDLRIATFDQWWDQDHCDGGANKNYIMMAVKGNNINDADNINATVEGVYVKICHDHGGNLEDVQAMAALYRRQSCNVISEVVQPPGAGGAKNKAWAVRTDQASGYTVPDLNLKYLNDKEPFGAILAPEEVDAPSDWPPTLPNPTQLRGFSAAEPRPEGGPARAGFPYTCRTECSTQKRCFVPQYPPLAEGGTWNAGPICSTAQQINDCNNLNEGAVCLGRPAGRCSANPLRACSVDSDCSGAGTCTLATATAGENEPLSYAADHLKRIFAASYRCFQLQTTTTDQCELGCPGNERTVLRSEYVPCDAATAAATTWDVKSEPYCAGDTRPSTWPQAFCRVRPTVENFSLNGLRGGNFTIPVGQPITGGFTYRIDAEQEPLTTATILWDFLAGQNQGDADDACEAVLQLTPETGRISMTNTYENPGSFQPVACVKDNWEAIRALIFPGTITVQ